MVVYLEGTHRHSPTEREEIHDNSMVRGTFEQVPPGTGLEYYHFTNVPFRVRKEDEMSFITKFSEMVGFKSPTKLL
jgi:hypothetical protein